jgi:hypothetical protein
VLDGFLYRFEIKAHMILESLVFATNHGHFDVVADVVIIYPSVLGIYVVGIATAVHECR